MSNFQTPLSNIWNFKRSVRFLMFMATATLFLSCAPKDNPTPLADKSTKTESNLNENSAKIEEASVSKKGSDTKGQAKEPIPAGLHCFISYEGFHIDMNKFIDGGLANTLKPTTVFLGTFDPGSFTAIVLRGRVIELKVEKLRDAKMETVASRKFLGSPKDPVVQILEIQDGGDFACAEKSDFLKDDFYKNFKTAPKN